MKRIRVVRVIVLTGPEDWVKSTLAASYVHFGDGPRLIGGSNKQLEEIDRYVDLTFEQEGKVTPLFELLKGPQS